MLYVTTLYVAWKGTPMTCGNGMETFVGPMFMTLLSEFIFYMEIRYKQTNKKLNEKPSDSQGIF